jgi:two-component system, response regulator, stage 0 sporulation protein F
MADKKRLLIIDDDKNMRELLELEFKDQDYDVITAENAFEGLQVLKNESVDLVVLDIKMPGMDGIEALEKIVSIYRELPVVIHSAYSHFKENYLTWSAVAYVIKSGKFDELFETVKTHIG